MAKQADVVIALVMHWRQLKDPAKKKKVFTRIEHAISRLPDASAGKTIRGDTMLTHWGSGERYLLDTVIVHNTVASSVTHTAQRIDTNVDRWKQKLPFKTSSAIEEAVMAKFKGYALLMSLMWMLYETGELSQKPPTFIPCAANTRGELSPYFTRLIEIVTKARKDMAYHTGPRPDGLKPEDVAARFRTDFKTDINLTIHRGIANTFRLGGLIQPFKPVS